MVLSLVSLILGTFTFSNDEKTDTDSTNEKNLALSVKRAQAVKSVMLKKGIDESRIVARGFGETKPVISNRTSVGRSQNRRAEVIVVTKTPRTSIKK